MTSLQYWKGKSGRFFLGFSGLVVAVITIPGLLYFHDDLLALWGGRGRLTSGLLLGLAPGLGLASWALWSHRQVRRLAHELSARKRSETQLRKLSRAVEQSPVSIVITDRRGAIEYVNPKFCELTGFTFDEARGQNPRMLKSGEMPPESYQELWKTLIAGREWRGQFHNKKKNGQPYWESASISPIVDEAGQITHFLAVKEDITERKAAEQRLKEMHRQLVEASRLAGMAEVATNILHNVGNVLNSVNVAASCATDALRNSRVTTLSKLAELLRQHESDWPAFATADPRGKQVPKYVAQLAACLAAENASALEELSQLQKNIDHIKDIVITQQAYAKVSGITETVEASDLVRDALYLNASSLTRRDFQVTEEFAPAPPVAVDKHKVLGILVNLIRNAKYACEESGRSDKHLIVRVANGENRVKISVLDNGVGIPPENMPRIFNHGFTTRKNGHGFGLHSGALAAMELGGSLSAHSDGPGKGARFTLELPAAPGVSAPSRT
jgi:PAS domain S-box-containing protein